MSVDVEFREHLVTTFPKYNYNKIEKSSISFWAGLMNKLLKRWLAILGALTLIDEAWLYNLRLTTGGQSYHFTGGITPDQLKTVLDAIQEDVGLDLFLDYKTTPDCLDTAGPISTLDFIKYMAISDPQDFIRSQLKEEGKSIRLTKKRKQDLAEDALDGIFYSCFICPESDCNTYGTCVAYGLSPSGKFHMGALEYQTVDAIPASGRWVTRDSAVCYDPYDDDQEGIDMQAVTKICSEMIAAFDPKYSQIHYYDDCPDIIRVFSLYNATLETPERVQLFIDLFHRLSEATDSTARALGLYLDIDSADPRMMWLDFDDDANPAIKLIEV